MSHVLLHRGELLLKHCDFIVYKSDVITRQSYVLFFHYLKFSSFLCLLIAFPFVIKFYLPIITCCRRICDVDLPQCRKAQRIHAKFMIPGKLCGYEPFSLTRFKRKTLKSFLTACVCILMTSILLRPFDSNRMFQIPAGY